MGMYTDLEFTATIKPEYVNLIKTLYETFTWKNLGYEFTDIFSRDSRSGFIPFGAPLGDHSFTENEWKVNCSLKNYDNTIQLFLDNVLSKIALSVSEMTTMIEGSTDWGVSHSEYLFDPITGEFTETVIRIEYDNYMNY